MRRLIPTLVVVTLVVAGCSSSELLAIDLAQPMQPPPAPIAVSGAAVDEGLVCAGGMFADYRMEDLDGNRMTDEEWGQTFESAMGEGTVAEVMSINSYECDGGSGTITVTQHVRIDFGEIDPEDFFQGEVNAGTWTLEGNGAYESLTGSGDIVNDNTEQMIHMIGEVEA